MAERPNRGPFYAPPAMSRIAGIAASSALDKALAAQRRNFADSPAMRSIEQTQQRLSGLATSPALARAFAAGARPYNPQPRSVAVGPSIQALFRRWVTRAFESVEGYVDRNWADIDTEHADHPAPVLFLIGSFSVAVGRPLLQAVKTRDDDSLLLDALEPVVTDADFVQEVRVAIRSSSYLNEIQKRHLITAFGWVEELKYIDAYPPFYNGLEPGFKNFARAEGVVDEKDRLIESGKKVNKVEDLLGVLVVDPRYRRFLRAWIFGDRGNPFRHGDVTDADECRRQSLRLAAAVIGWLELFGGWEESTFRDRLETEVDRRTQIAVFGEPA